MKADEKLCQHTKVVIIFHTKPPVRNEVSQSRAQALHGERSGRGLSLVLCPVLCPQLSLPRPRLPQALQPRPAPGWFRHLALDRPHRPWELLQAPGVKDKNKTTTPPKTNLRFVLSNNLF